MALISQYPQHLSSIFMTQAFYRWLACPYISFTTFTGVAVENACMLWCKESSGLHYGIVQLLKFLFFFASEMRIKITSVS